MEKLFVDYKSLHAFLKGYGSAGKPIPAKIRRLALVTRSLEKANSPEHLARIEAQKVVHDALGQLAKINLLHAKLIEQHFLNPHPQARKIDQVRQELDLTERQFLAEQKKAINGLVLILNEQEARYLKSVVLAEKSALLSNSQTELFGIDEVVNRLDQEFSTNPVASIMVISGMGGMGKSTLANQIVLAAMDNLAFHYLVRIDAPLGYLNSETLYTEIYAQLKLKTQHLMEQPDRPTKLAKLLNQFSVLIYIDGIEERIDLLIEDILPLRGHANFLITSRQVPDISFDLFHYPLKPMPAAMAKALLESTHAALNFDLQSTKLSIPAGVFQKLYQKVGGNPLAIKLIAGLLTEMSVEEILEELKSVDHPETGHLFERVFFRVWQDMHDGSKRVLITLGLFQKTKVTKETLLRLNKTPGPDRFKITKGSLNDILTDLRLRSLVEVERERLNREFRFGIHNLTRTFLNSHVIEWPEGFLLKTKNGRFSPLSIVEDGISDWLAYADRLEQVDRPEEETIQDLNSICEMIYLGLCWNRTRSQSIELMQTVWSLLFKHGHFTTLEEHIVKGINDLNDSNEDPVNLIRLKNRLGQIWRMKGKVDQAIALHLEVLELAETLNAPILCGNCYFQIGEDYLVKKEFNLAEIFAQKAVSQFNNRRFQYEMSCALNTLGNIYLKTEKFEQALINFEDSLTYLNFKYHLADALVVLRNIAFVQKRLGEVEASKSTFNEIIKLALNHQYERANAQNELGRLFLDEEKYEEALDCFLRAKNEDLRERDHIVLHLLLFRNLGLTYLRLGRFDDAAVCLERSVSGWLEREDKLNLGRTYAMLGEAYLLQQRYESAIETYNMSLNLLKGYDSEKILLVEVQAERELAVLRKEKGSHPSREES